MKSLEETYLDSRKEYYKNWEKKFPLFHKLVFGKRYILPNYRQPDYHKADACDYLMLDGFFAYLEGAILDTDHVMGHCTSNFVESLNYGRPTFYLEKELGFPLMRTKLPLDYYTSDIKWRWPAFRVYLPKDLLFLTRKDEGTQHGMFLDIAHIDKGGKTNLPSGLNDELTRVLGKPGKHKIPLRASTFEGMCVSCSLDFEGRHPAIAYTSSSTLEEKTIRGIMAQMHETLPSPWKLDKIDQVFNNQMLALAINILIYLSSIPMEYEQKETSAIRKPRMEGQHFMSGLYPARFVGSSQLRPKAHPEAHVASISTGSTGKHLEPHWRAGHWKRIWYGPKKTENKLVWIALYHTGDKEDEK